MNNASFSVSIVLYQHEPSDLNDLILNLENSPDIKIVYLVDNGGCAWAKDIPYKKFQYLKSPKNGGFGYGHNLAINLLSDDLDFHIVCNPDIKFDIKSISDLGLAIKDRPEDLFMPNVIYENGRRQELCKLLPSPLNLFARRFLPGLAEKLDNNYLLRDADFCKPFFAPSLSGCFMVCRTHALKSLGGFDERYFMYLEDVDLSRRLAALGGALYVPSVNIIHIFQKGSYKNRKLFIYHIVSAIKYFNKWGWIWDEERRAMNKVCLKNLPKNILAND
ncbi:glycosyltransferase family 2 protein [Comamonas thiooxydans]|uniref:glycosyltransferase family 2 protein n=1 Tax=Comamonas thiooxydans TaxID=363952 RepID=UPI0009B89B5A|nr:glycosyltransferase family 2 protein [Comamonas thiooxydans]MDO1476699.1 glycosyltransferase family 2 protein [Comamonas thiooxydans]